MAINKIYMDASIEGLSVGDSFGEKFFGNPEVIKAKIVNKILPEAPWRCTDDSIMGISVAKTLSDRGKIDQEYLIAEFSRLYSRDPARGYGRSVHEILGQTIRGADWRRLSADAFDGTGSMGNGAAMRAAPIGVYFYEFPEQIVRQSKLSAEVTHMNTEGKLGAVTVALAASWIIQISINPNFGALFDYILVHLESSILKDKIITAQKLEDGIPISKAALILGTGRNVLAHDTVPFCLWIVKSKYIDFVDAMWSTVSGLGDRDTTCAIVGSIIGPFNDGKNIPEEWIRRRENLDAFR